MKIPTKVWALSVALLSASVAQSQNLLTNGSFELGQSPGSGAIQISGGGTAITGWEVVGDEIAWIHNSNGDSIVASDGLLSLDLAGFLNNTQGSGVRQSFSTVSGQLYRVSFDIGAGPAYGEAGLTVSAAGQSGQFVEPVGLANHWRSVSWDFIAVGSISTLEIRETSPGSTIWNGLDNVSVVAAVPEPTTLAALGLGALGLLRRRKLAQS